MEGSAPLTMASDDTARVDLGVFGWLNRVLVLLIVAAVAGVAALKYVPLIRTNMRLVQREQELRESVAAKKAQSIRLSHRIRQLRENPRVIEREARSQLGLARPDEMVLWISSPASREAGAPGGHASRGPSGQRPR